MKRRSRSAALLLVLSLPTMFAACGRSIELASPQISIPDTCEQKFGKTIPLPALKAGEDALVALAQTRAAVGMSNRQTIKRNECDADVRRSYANAR